MLRVPIRAALGVVLAFALGCGGAKAPGAPASADAAPDFTLADLNGRSVSLKDFRGRVVMLDFWATWCPPCRMSIPALEQLQKDYAGKKFQVVGVSVDEEPRLVPDFAKENGMEYPILLAGDSPITQLYRIRGIPAMFLIDRDGKVAKRWVGYDPRMNDEWRASIDQLLAS